MNNEYGSRLTWESAAELHTGYVRKENQDAVLNRPDLCIWAVADGMGGHAAGAAASRLVVEGLSSLEPSGSLDERVAGVVAKLEAANHQLVTAARTRGQGLSGSTVAVLLTLDDQGVALWVGDSRIYRYRNGDLNQLTRDHSQLEELIERGLMDRDASKAHPSSNVITRAIGAAATLEPDIKRITIRAGDLFLICSDGLYNEIDEKEISKALADGSCARSATALFALTLNSPARDNFSFVIARADTEDNDKTLLKPLKSNASINT